MGAFLASLTVILATTFGIGRFGGRRADAIAGITDATRLPDPFEICREHIENSLRAVDARIAKGEHRLLAHGKLMERLKDGGRDLTIAHQLKLNLETGLRLFRATRVRLLTELEQDRNPS